MTGRYNYRIEWLPPGQTTWERHPWTRDGDKRADANAGLRLLQANQPPLEHLGLWGPLRISRLPLDTA